MNRTAVPIHTNSGYQGIPKGTQSNKLHIVLGRKDTKSFLVVAKATNCTLYFKEKMKKYSKDGWQKQLCNVLLTKQKKHKCSRNLWKNAWAHDFYSNNRSNHKQHLFLRVNSTAISEAPLTVTQETLSFSRVSRNIGKIAKHHRQWRKRLLVAVE